MAFGASPAIGQGLSRAHRGAVAGQIAYRLLINRFVEQREEATAQGKRNGLKGYQFPFPHRSSRNGSSREPVESIRNLQDRSARAGIGQLPRHLPCLLGTIQPFQGFIRDRRHWVLPSLLESGPLAARPSLAADFPLL